MGWARKNLGFDPKAILTAGAGYVLGGPLGAVAGGLLGGGGKMFGGPSSPGSIQNDADPYNGLREKYMGELAKYTDNKQGEQFFRDTGHGAFIQSLWNTQAGFKFDENNPAYQTRLNQGMEATARKMAAMGHTDSGNLWSGLTDYAQNQASLEYDNQYNRWMQGNSFLANLGTTSVGLEQQRFDNLARLANVDQGNPAAAAQLRMQKSQQNTGLIGNILGGLFGSA